MYIQKQEMQDQHLPGFCPFMGVPSPEKGFDSLSVFIVFLAKETKLLCQFVATIN